VLFDRSTPDGTPRKLLDVGKIEALGWKASTPLRDGIRATYDWYLASAKQARAG
jgi:GDP-L-fucose synthase